MCPSVRLTSIELQGVERQKYTPGRARGRLARGGHRPSVRHPVSFEGPRRYYIPCPLCRRSLSRGGRVQTICRLIQLSPEEAAGLVASQGSLSNRIQSATAHSDVYRYWHAIEYLLA